MRYALLILLGISVLLGSLWWLRTAEDPMKLVFHVELWVWATIGGMVGFVTFGFGLARLLNRWEGAS